MSKFASERKRERENRWEMRVNPREAQSTLLRSHAIHPDPPRRPSVPLTTDGALRCYDGSCFTAIGERNFRYSSARPPRDGFDFRDTIAARSSPLSREAKASLKSVRQGNCPDCVHSKPQRSTKCIVYILYTRFHERFL